MGRLSFYIWKGFVVKINNIAQTPTGLLILLRGDWSLAT
jgi:hypothetical protein